MNRILQHMLNIHPSSWTQGGQWHMEWKSLPKHDMGLLLAAAVAIVAWIVMMVYRREGKSLHFMSRWSLIGLRLIVLGGALVMLLEPVLVFTRIDHPPSNLIILSDVSGSMDLQDAYSDAHTITGITSALNIREQDLQKSTRRQLIDRALDMGLRKKLEANGDRIVHPIDFAARLLPPTTQPRGTNDSDTAGTAIGVAIRQAIGTYQGQPIAGVLLLTDGQNNTGEDPEKAAHFAGAAGVPVVSLTVGTEEGPKWAKITKLDVPSTIVFNDRVLAHVLVDSHGMKGVPATVKLYRSEEGAPPQEIASQTITLGETGRQQTVQFDFTEQQKESAVKLQFTAALENAGTELKPQDHHTPPADVKAINDRMRVLFIAGETFPEVEFIRDKLLRDRHISASTWNQTADVGYEQPGDPVIPRLPETAEELKDNYDCIILYDPDPNLWPSGFSDALNDFVGKEGGGLIFVAGERNTKNLFDRPDDPTLTWLNMLPVQVEPGLYHTDVSVKLSSQNAWKLTITDEGKADPIFDFANQPDHPDANEAIYESLPGMYWHFPVTRARAGATVLARHGDPRMHNEHGQHVLLATQLVGAGRTFFCAFDSTYRWRYLDDQYFESFWSHLVERAGHAKQWGGNYPYKLSTDRSEYRPGSQVTVSAHFDNPLDRGPNLDVMHGEVRTPNPADPPTDIVLTPRPGDPNTFDATFTVDKPVTHTVYVWSGDPELKSHPNSLPVAVVSPNLEYDNPGINTGILQAIANASGGKRFDLADFNKIPDAFTIRRVDHPLEDRQEIWNAPIIFTLILISIVLEWVMRKKLQLV